MQQDEKRKMSAESLFFSVQISVGVFSLLLEQIHTMMQRAEGGHIL